MIILNIDMEASTPLIPASDLRRQTLLRNAVNMSPLRRSLTPAFNTSLLEDSNDDSERLARRSIVQIQRRLSNIGDQDKAPLNESYIKKQFVICTHLFTENKITTKNAWKLEIIDLLKPICQKVSKDTLQVASTSIDISAKVYGIRVDDIHSDGLKLASSMARVSDKVPPQDAEGEEAAGDENGQDQDKQTGSKKKKKKRPTGQKTTVTTTKATLGPLPKLEPVDFTTRVNADTGAIDNLFTNVLKEDNSSITFAFVDKQMTFMSKEDPLVKNNSDAHVPISSLLPLEDVTNIRLNVPFSDFKLDDWDPELEEKMLAEKSMFTQTQGVAFDENGIPIPELDGSIPDIFENHMDDVHSDGDNGNDIEFVQETVAPQQHGEVARIVDFRSINTTAQTSEYSYNTIVNTRAGNYIDQIWAGPCHWKLKFIRRSSIRFSGARTETAVALKHRRKKAPPEMLTYANPEEIDFLAKLIIRKKPPTPDINKVTLPIKINIQFEETIDELMLKPETCAVEKKKIDENVEYDIGPYKYENPHDSFYCSQQDGGDGGIDAGDGGDGGDDDHFDAETEEHVMADQQNFLGENLVDLPQMVPESYIPFAMKAKQMDMKKLKAAIWQKLTNKTIILEAQSQRSGAVIPTTFSEMYTHLPEVLAEKEKKELTCPLAFVALLHLCNEQNLALKQLPGYTDFQIKGPS